MLQRICQVDWARAGQHFALITLTWPGAFSGNPDHWKAQLSAFRLRWGRQYDKPMRGMWVMEWQRPRPHGGSAGAAGPHFHIVAALPDGAGFADAESFAKTSWNAIVAPGHTDHLEHGADMKPANVVTAPVYLAREVGKKRQKELPPEWAATGAGRWWGVWGLEVVEHSTTITQDEFMRLRRALRRLALRNTKPIGGYCDLRTRRIYMPLGSFARGYEMRARYKDQGGGAFSRSSPWVLTASMTRYLELIRGTPVTPVITGGARGAETVRMRSASLAGAARTQIELDDAA